MTEYLDDLQDLGLTQEMLDEFSDLNEEFELARNSQANAVALRDEKTFERINKGNEIYKLVSRYSNFGKRIYEKSNPPRYNDYLIYDGSGGGSGSGTVPGIPEDRSYNHLNHVFTWSAVEGAASYQVECLFDDGVSDWVNFYDGAATQTILEPGDGGWYIRVRASNSSGSGEWSGTMYIGYMNNAPLNLVPTVTYGTNTQVSLNFSLIGGVPQYRLFLGYGPLGSSEVPELTGSIFVTESPIAVPTTVANQRYFMGLKCYNGEAYGVISQIVSIDVNGLTS